ncbi:hypothetical protein Nepgr_021677 [Nepenthes gracilis]|uniref:Uncharacterized protein n=1 Tax=Nepenthes gracilis TaxID=150966 RepID=A0AAD3T1B6_NEPGR|nr:hypothetical protein Nepgr_021677 [Nepenthes gracilis]
MGAVDVRLLHLPLVVRCCWLLDHYEGMHWRALALLYLPNVSRPQWVTLVKCCCCSGLARQWLDLNLACAYLCYCPFWNVPLMLKILVAVFGVAVDEDCIGLKCICLRPCVVESTLCDAKSCVGSCLEVVCVLVWPVCCSLLLLDADDANDPILICGPSFVLSRMTRLVVVIGVSLALPLAMMLFRKLPIGITPLWIQHLSAVSDDAEVLIAAGAWLLASQLLLVQHLPRSRHILNQQAPAHSKNQIQFTAGIDAVLHRIQRGREMPQDYQIPKQASHPQQSVTQSEAALKSTEQAISQKSNRLTASTASMIITCDQSDATQSEAALKSTEQAISQKSNRPTASSASMSGQHQQAITLISRCSTFNSKRSINHTPGQLRQGQKAVGLLVNVEDCWWIVWGRSEAMYLAAEGKLIGWAADCCISWIALGETWLALIDNGGLGLVLGLMLSVSVLLLAGLDLSADATCWWAVGDSCGCLGLFVLVVGLMLSVGCWVGAACSRSRLLLLSLPDLLGCSSCFESVRLGFSPRLPEKAVCVDCAPGPPSPDPPVDVSFPGVPGSPNNCDVVEGALPLPRSCSPGQDFMLPPDGRPGVHFESAILPASSTGNMGPSCVINHQGNALPPYGDVLDRLALWRELLLPLAVPMPLPVLWVLLITLLEWCGPP